MREPFQCLTQNDNYLASSSIIMPTYFALKIGSNLDVLGAPREGLNTTGFMS